MAYHRGDRGANRREDFFNPGHRESRGDRMGGYRRDSLDPGCPVAGIAIGLGESLRGLVDRGSGSGTGQWPVAASNFARLGLGLLRFELRFF